MASGELPLQIDGKNIYNYGYRRIEGKLFRIVGRYASSQDALKDKAKLETYIENIYILGDESSFKDIASALIQHTTGKIRSQRRSYPIIRESESGNYYDLLLRDYKHDVTDRKKKSSKAKPKRKIVKKSKQRKK